MYMYMYHKFDAILFLQTLDIYKINMKLNLHVHTYEHISVENKKVLHKHTHPIQCTYRNRGRAYQLPCCRRKRTLML